MKARKLKVCINIDNNLLYCVYPKWGQGSITLGVMSLGRFSNFAIVENFYKRFLHINMDNDWMYCVYWNRGQESITL